MENFEPVYIDLENTENNRIKGRYSPTKADTPNSLQTNNSLDA